MNFSNLFKLILLFSIPFVLTGCRQNNPSIRSGKLTVSVDRRMQTALTIGVPMKKPITYGFMPSEYLTIGEKKLADFRLQTVSEEKTEGKGRKLELTGVFEGFGLHIEKKLMLTVYDDLPELVLFNVVYKNLDTRRVEITRWVNNHYRVLQNNQDTLFWSFQGQSTEARADWILPVTKGFYQPNYMGMNNTDYGGGIPVSDLWRSDGGIAVGHASLHPELLSLPVQMKEAGSAELSVEKRFDREPFMLEPGKTLTTPQTFVLFHQGDAFAALRKFALLMKKKGIRFNRSPETAYEPIWCAWGYERLFTMEEVESTLPKVKELGIRWVVIDDGYQRGEGDWNVDTRRFPEGNKAMKKLVDKIHQNGLKAKLWWAPLALDPCTPLWNNHYHDILLLNEDTSPRFITWWDAYYMSPVAPITHQETRKVLNMFFDEWGFDGLKMDGQHMNNVPPDFNQRHHLEDPAEAPQKLPDFFKTVYNISLAKKADAVVENCPCGCCINFYNLAGMNQAVSSDPLNSWQIRLKGKVYHALNPYLAYYGDHVELSDNGNDFASSFGVGAVLGTKFTWPRDNPHASDSYLLTPEKEKKWKKWFDLYIRLMLSKGEYLGNLYDIGFEKPETHVIRKEGKMYYAFYAERFEGKVKLKGLNQGMKYSVYDYVHDKTLATVSGSDPYLKISFVGNLLIDVSPLR